MIIMYSEEHINEVFLPKRRKQTGHPNHFMSGFFRTGAYRDQISGYGGIKHCLIPSPKHVIVGHGRKWKVDGLGLRKTANCAKSALKFWGTNYEKLLITNYFYFTFSDSWAQFEVALQLPSKFTSTALLKNRDGSDTLPLLQWKSLLETGKTS
jgi:hypothetical protein